MNSYSPHKRNQQKPSSKNCVKLKTHFLRKEVEFLQDFKQFVEDLSKFTKSKIQSRQKEDYPKIKRRNSFSVKQQITHNSFKDKNDGLRDQKVSRDLEEIEVFTKNISQKVKELGSTSKENSDKRLRHLSENLQLDDWYDRVEQSYQQSLAAVEHRLETAEGNVQKLQFIKKRNQAFDQEQQFVKIGDQSNFTNQKSGNVATINRHVEARQRLFEEMTKVTALWNKQSKSSKELGQSAGMWKKLILGRTNSLSNEEKFTFTKHRQSQKQRVLRPRSRSELMVEHKKYQQKPNQIKHKKDQRNKEKLLSKNANQSLLRLLLSRKTTENQKLTLLNDSLRKAIKESEESKALLTLRRTNENFLKDIGTVEFQNHFSAISSTQKEAIYLQWILEQQALDKKLKHTKIEALSQSKVSMTSRQWPLHSQVASIKCNGDTCNRSRTCLSRFQSNVKKETHHHGVKKSGISIINVIASCKFDEKQVGSSNETNCKSTDE